ncbi:hypothetical protein BC777_2841 [Yoonia maricola]|uniref:DAPG hydrolase PhiG domain-containing protein n=2 Tax=Yoonia maricola TaxID=420999 RepID=A0A2M8W6A7_9RHOB|nr:hypothetical protein BC777_2841 [Yoonia maricola]
MDGLVIIGVAAAAMIFAIFGWNPFAQYRDTSGLLTEGYSKFETGVKRQPNGVYRVRALTRMPGVTPEMVRWWFTDYMQTTDHYKQWHSQAHVWMDWENKTPGEIVGAAHLVHEYIGIDLSKLRISFVDASELLGPLDIRGHHFIVGARVGMLEEPIDVTTMCHFVRDTEFGAEMRSVFWMGHVANRGGTGLVDKLKGVLGNTWLARRVLVREAVAVNLMTHAIEEMGNLSDFLPDLYAKEMAIKTA